MGLRFLAFGQLNKWLEGSDNHQHVEKRSYLDEDNQGKSSI
jgi:hypothetical protein